jgi:hypothetical protein
MENHNLRSIFSPCVFCSIGMRLPFSVLVQIECTSFAVVLLFHNQDQGSSLREVVEDMAALVFHCEEDIQLARRIGDRRGKLMGVSVEVHVGDMLLHAHLLRLVAEDIPPEEEDTETPASHEDLLVDMVDLTAPDTTYWDESPR